MSLRYGHSIQPGIRMLGLNEQGVEQHTSYNNVAHQLALKKYCWCFTCVIFSVDLTILYKLQVFLNKITSYTRDSMVF